MKWLTLERHLTNKGWHRWFAWYPVASYSQWHWLEYVERRHIFSSWSGHRISYRPITK